MGMCYPTSANFVRLASSSNVSAFLITTCYTVSDVEFSEDGAQSCKYTGESTQKLKDGKLIKKKAGNGTKEWFTDYLPVKQGQLARYKGTFLENSMEGVGK